MKAAILGALTCCLLIASAVAFDGDGPAPATPAANADTRTPGQKLYGKHCLPCHQADGRGVPDMQPAIAGGTWVKGDAQALALFVMSGGFNSAERKDSANGNVMPPFSQLSDDDLAQILTYVREKFGAGASAVSAADVTAARAKLPPAK